MPRRSGGGFRSYGGGVGRRSYSASRARTPPPSYSASRARAPTPAPPKKAPAPAPAAGSLGSGGVMSTIADGYLWSTGWAMAQRSMDRIFGPRKLEVEHTATPAAAAAPPASSPCDLHAQAFQDCINHNGSDISRCQFYVDLLNDCRSRGKQVDAVQAA